MTAKTKCTYQNHHYNISCVRQRAVLLQTGGRDTGKKISQVININCACELALNSPTLLLTYDPAFLL